MQTTNPLLAGTGDFNHRGGLDAAVLRASNIVDIALGFGDGSFTDTTNYQVGGNPQGGVVADLNGDGYDDIVAISLAASQVSVLINKGGSH